MHHVAVELREYKEHSSRTSVRAGKPWDSVADAHRHHGAQPTSIYSANRVVILSFGDELLKRFLERPPGEKQALVERLLKRVLETDQLPMVDPLPILRELHRGLWARLRETLSPALPHCRSARVHERHLDQSAGQLLLDTNHDAGRAMSSNRWPNQWVNTRPGYTRPRRAVADRKCQIRLLQWRLAMRRWPGLKNDIGHWKATGKRALEDSAEKKSRIREI